MVNTEEINKIVLEEANKLYPPKIRYEMDGMLKIDENESLRDAYIKGFLNGYFTKIENYD